MGEMKDGVFTAGLVVLAMVLTVGFVAGWLSHSIIF